MISYIRRVGLNTVREGVIGEDKDRCRGDQLLEFIEKGLLWGSPTPSDIFLGEVKEGAHMVREILDEPLVEIHKSDKGLDFPFVARLRPLQNSGHFYQVHLYCSLQDNYSEILYMSTLELALLWLEA